MICQKLAAIFLILEAGAVSVCPRLEKAVDALPLHDYITARRVALAALDAPGKLDPQCKAKALLIAGVSSFHLARYREASGYLKDVVEMAPADLVALGYLTCARWAAGDRAGSMEAFSWMLEKGARNLYPVMELCGERFLDDDEVEGVIDRHRRVLRVQLEGCSVAGVRLGESAVPLLKSLGLPADKSNGAVSARAGRRWLWTFELDKGKLVSAAFDVQTMLFYTPYRPELDWGLDWRVLPMAATSVLGKPDSGSVEGDGVLTWCRGSCCLSLEFGAPMRKVKWLGKPPVLTGIVIRRKEGG